LELPFVVGGGALFLFWVGMRLTGRELLPRGPSPAVAFRLLDVIAIFVGYILLMGTLMGVGQAIGLPTKPQIYLFSFLGPGAIAIAAYFLALAPRREHGPRALGVLAGLGAWIAVFPLVALTLVGWNALLELFGYAWEEQRVLTDLRAEPVVFFLSAVVLAPVCEEVMFRGLLYPALKNKIGVGLSMAVTAALFAMVHWHLQTFPPLFVLGLALAHLYERTGTLAAPISFHAMFNFWTFLGATAWS
jgi:membrane protease YdiL (CAAX protease family)